MGMPWSGWNQPLRPQDVFRAKHVIETGIVKEGVKRRGVFCL